MNDNRPRAPAGRLGAQRQACERQFIALLQDLQSSGMSWTAIASGVVAAQGAVDTALDEIGARASAEARQRRGRGLRLV